MIKNQTIKSILGIQEPIALTVDGMVSDLDITFYPTLNSPSKDIFNFCEKLKATLNDLHANIIPYEQALNLKKRIREGVATIIAGDGDARNLPVDHISKPRDNPVAAIVETPGFLDQTATFEQHMELATKLFAYHMANVIVCVRKNKWLVYSLNGYSPVYDINEDFSGRILRAFIPKLAAPLKPPLLTEFQIEKWDYEETHKFFAPYINDIVQASKLFHQTSLYPPAGTFDALTFRSHFYKKIGKLYLDKRSGMSYGFFARQIPPVLPKPLSREEVKNEIKGDFKQGQELIICDKGLYLALNILKEAYYVRVPDVWVITTRSGCEKTNINPSEDLIRLGLVKGRMIISVPEGVDLSSGYRPSFDSKLILSMAVANAIYASILKHTKPKASLPAILEKTGMALAHWHGYISLKHAPQNWYIDGLSNPAVCCSTHQSAVYAFKHKEEFFMKCLKENKAYSGDIHIEPHHGISVTYDSLVGLAEFVLSHMDTFKLGVLEMKTT